eukprot:TRINITY_DN2242_c0_g1_i4.p1 TRINITY_DN2242_c0_g1~~TRINITY_DN2242_c0_g1_i4.p1  ORF type:complete len:611 (+),score=200.91 TRINITY_DN2242_c0_g1_i4:90-1922(+)
MAVATASSNIPMDLHFSRVGPAMETQLNDVLEGVTSMADIRRSQLTQSQNERMMGYLGGIDDMKKKLALMVGHYQDNEKVTGRLLALYDRLDEILSQIGVPDGASLSQYTGGAGPSGAAHDDEDEEDDESDDDVDNVQADSAPALRVSVLGASGIMMQQMFDEMEEAFRADSGSDSDDEGGNRWDDVDVREGEEVLALNEDEEPAPHNPLRASIAGDGPAIRMSRQQFEVVASAAPQKSAMKSVVVKGITAEELKVMRRRVMFESISSDDESDSPGPVAEPVPAVAPASSSSSSSSSSSTPTTSTPDVKGKGKARGRVHEPVLCKICYDDAVYPNVFKFNKCGHEYCRECLNGYLVNLINEGAVLDMTCPSPGCKTEVTPYDVQRLVKPSVFGKFERFTVLASLKADPNTRWCPRPGCETAMKGSAEKPHMTCKTCHYEFCFSCKEEWHEGAKCGKEAEAMRAKRQEVQQVLQDQFEDWKKKQSFYVRPCPLCQAPIEKNEGCNHMTCVSCKGQFCWLCLAPYNSNHFNNQAEFPKCYEKQFWAEPLPVLEPVAAEASGSRGNKHARRAKKVGMYVGLGVGVLTLGVPALVIGGPIYGVFKLTKRLRARR